jgi:hypothetical protein
MAGAPPSGIKALNYGLLAFLAMLPMLVLGYEWATGH